MSDILKRIRILVDTASPLSIIEQVSGQIPRFFAGNDLRFEMSFVNNGVLLDADDIDQVHIEVKNFVNGQPPLPSDPALMSKFTSTLDNTSTLEDFIDGSGQQCVIEFDNAETSIAAGPKFLVVWATSDDTPSTILTVSTGTIRVDQAGSGPGQPPPDPIEQLLTVSVANATYLRLDGTNIGGAVQALFNSKANVSADNIVATTWRGVLDVFSRGGTTSHASAMDTGRTPLADGVNQSFGTATGNIVIAGGGTAAANGAYEPDGDLNGKTRYTKAGGVTSQDTLQWSGTRWQIRTGAFATLLYSSPDDVATPDLVTTWERGTGTLPHAGTAGIDPVPFSLAQASATVSQVGKALVQSSDAGQARQVLTPVAAPTASADTLAIDFAAEAAIQIRNQDGDADSELTFTASNMAAGRSQTILVTEVDEDDVDLVFPADWKWLTPIPAKLFQDTSGALQVVATGTNEADVYAAWSAGIE